jgi:hypothetical protein
MRFRNAISQCDFAMRFRNVWFERIVAEIIVKTLTFSLNIQLVFEKMYHNSGLKKTPFFAENRQKSPKIVIIPLTPFLI